MAKKPNIGAVIALDGEKEYRQAISNVTKSLNVLKSDMKAVSAEFYGNANSLEALRAKHEVYLKQQDEQDKKLRLLRGALEDANKQYGEGSKQAQNWQIKLNNAYAELTKLNREIDQNERYMKEAEQSTDKTAKSIDEYGKEIKDASDKTKIFGDVLKANLLSDAIYDGVRRLGSIVADTIKESIALASDLEESQNVVSVTFGNNEQAINRWAKSLDTSVGIAELSAKKYIGTMGAMLKSMNLTEEQVYSMSTAMVELTGDMASFYNLSTDEVFAKIRSGISGETEPLKQLGINLNVANLEAYALAEGIEKTYSQMDQGEQALLRFNYLMKVTADAQGDFTRNIDSLANQQRILELQLTNIKTQMGEAMIPAITQAFNKLNEEIDKADVNLGDIAETLTEGLVDGFVWLIDNMDTVLAGLKGIAAAVITKKSADGVMLLINAYKTLTTATQTATTAQIAFNTASKANVYVAIASVVVGLGTAIYSYAKNAKDAANESERLSDKTQELLDNSRELREEIEKRSQTWAEETRNIEAQYGALELLADKLYDLSDKERKSNDEKQQMVSLVKQLNDEIPDLNIKINEQTGELSLQRAEIELLIEAQKEFYLVQAAEKNYTDIANRTVQAEMERTRLLEEQKRIYMQIAHEKRLLGMLGDEYNASSGHNNAVAVQIIERQKALESLEEGYRKLGDEIKAQDNILSESEKQWNDNEEYIKKYTSSLKTAGSSLDEFTEKYKKALDDQAESEIGTLESRQKQIGKLYDESSKELEKRLRAEERAFTKSQQARVNEVQKAQEQELTELEKSHKAKLDLINEEYMEKLKLVDEDRYNQLKEIQDQIDNIDNQQEAEDRALKAREDAEKKAELQTRIETAKTAEERIDAQNELKKFEEKLARERLKDERTLQKNILKEQKETIEDSFDKKIKAIEEEQKIEQEKLIAQHEADKQSISERYKLKLEILKEEQELERDNLREQQAEYRQFLKNQKELAISNAKEIYEDDLARFKLNQAIKYEQTVNDEEKIKSAIKEYAYSHMGPGADRDRILRSDDINELTRYYNPQSIKPTTVSASITPAMIEEAMTSALKNLKLKVELNGKEIGNVVDQRIYRNLR